MQKPEKFVMRFGNRKLVHEPSLDVVIEIAMQEAPGLDFSNFRFEISSGYYDEPELSLVWSYKEELSDIEYEKLLEQWNSLQQKVSVKKKQTKEKQIKELQKQIELQQEKLKKLQSLNEENKA
jgi:hypothetical protein